MNYTILSLLIGIGLGFFLAKNKTTSLFINNHFVETFVTSNKIQATHWSKDFELVEISSSVDNRIQKSYFYKSKSKEPKPLIVSLHSWRGAFSQNDDIADICKKKELNYIHPDFRGANNTIEACCSDLALADIDDAITYAIKHANVDASNIFVIGLSGGGYATLSTFMKSNHKIKKFSAWASITDLIAWYNESKIRKNNYAENILSCTGSEDELDIEKARQRSPLFWNTPIEKLQSSKLFIYAGVYDGIQGSVPITHSINFYNKLLADLNASDTSKYVSNIEKLKLIEHQQPLGEFGYIAGRKICLKKVFGNVQLIIFEGKHEMLTDFALNELLTE